MNSPLATYTHISPSRNSPRRHKIDTVTIHCTAGQMTAKNVVDYLARPNVQASCNYAVGYDGSIAMGVEEKDRSWCSSSGSNDHRAVTIEVSSESSHPYKVTDKALASLIDLLVDICKRNGIPELRWHNDPGLIGQTDKQNMTLHRWFANKACPGQYLIDKHPQIVEAVNSRLHELPFKDVSSDHWAAKDILWAVEHGVAVGISENEFGPDLPCTRAQALVMIWAMEGKPHPGSDYIPFKDVSSEDYFSKAVLWAIERGVTAGISPSEFAPHRVCTRAEVITMLYALAGKPSQPPVKADLVGFGGPGDYYHQAMMWAYNEGITVGIGNGSLDPDGVCTRAMVVTMLHRADR